MNYWRFILHLIVGFLSGISFFSMENGVKSKDPTDEKYGDAYTAAFLIGSCAGFVSVIVIIFLIMSRIG
jgi:hypothetical protein